MASVTCAKCAKAFTRTCSCQGNICPKCKTRARAASSRSRTNGTTRTTNGARSAPAAATRVQFRVSYRDPKRLPSYHDTAAEAAAVRKAAADQGVRTFLRTVRREVAEAS